MTLVPEEKFKTDIPKARELINKAIPFVEDIEARALLMEALELMTRRVAKNPRTIARKITREIYEGVLALHERHPHLTHLEIAQKYNINPGRVAEIINGHRRPPDYAAPGDGMNRQ